MTVEIRLPDDQIDEIVDRLAQRLIAQHHNELITAGELAHRIGLSREWVYAHSQSLGVIRVGDGERPRLMFRWPQVLENLNSAEISPTGPTVPKQRPPRARRATSTDLLPIRGV